MTDRKTGRKPASPPPQPSKLMPLAVAGAGLLAVAGAGLFYYATQTAIAPEAGDLHKVTVGQTTCEPADFTLPAGRQTFEIHNASDRPIEWEILDGVMVLEERENIAPGFHSRLTAKLKPGTFEITCGLLSNPRGRLVVTPSDASEAERAAPPITAFIGPLSEYKVYLVTQSSALAAAVAKLSDAIAANDLEGARTAWLAARLPYKRIEAVTGRMADLENAINPLSDYLEGREQDPAFTGFHRIEYGLWGQNSTEGLVPVAAKLVTDVGALKDRLRAVKLAPEDLAGSAARQAGHMASGQIVAGEDRWAGSDLAGVEAGLDGIAKGAGVLLPLVREAAPNVAAQVETRVTAAQSALAAFKRGADYPAYGDLDEDARAGLARAFSDLDASLAAMNPAIGLD